MSNLKDTMSDLGSFISKLLVVIGIIMIVVGGYNLSAENMMGVPFVNKVTFFGMMNPWLFTAMGIGVYFLAYIFDGDAADDAVEDVKDGVGDVVSGTVSSIASVLTPFLPYVLLFFAGRWAWDKYNAASERNELEKDMDAQQKAFEMSMRQAQQLRDVQQVSAAPARYASNYTPSTESVIDLPGVVSPY